MDNMDIDSPAADTASSLNYRDRIIRQRLAALGIPKELLDQLHRGLVAYVKDNKYQIPEVVNAVLPTDMEVAEVLREAKTTSKKSMVGPTMKDQFRESLKWLQWLMFEDDFTVALRNLSTVSVGQRGVCGSVWGHNDIAYRCRTCEHDPTCAICVPCFQNGNHKDHDYSIIYTGGGCCDCGDVTAWKREGFCSKHRGAEQIQPLGEELAASVGPVLDALFVCWKSKLLSVENAHLENHRANDHVLECKKVANELTYAVVNMLLDFCKSSESLLSFISKMVISSAGFLEVLVRSERLLTDFVVRKVHELLLKLLGEPTFKYEFAKVFLSYYPVVVNKVIEECNDHVLKKYPLLSTFSVQIFTVPTLTPRLVKELNLLAMLLGCLGDIFVSCAGEDGHLQVTKWGNLYETTLRVVEDIRFVMSHAVVPKSVIYDQQDISRTWLRLLAFVQGMNPQKRETGLHIEEENENMHLPFGLCHSIANIHSLLVDGAFSVSTSEDSEEEISLNAHKETTDDIDCLRHAKVGRLSQESSACNVVGRTSMFATASKADEVRSDIIPPSFMWLTYECLRAIDNWLGVDNTSGILHDVFSSNTSTISGSNFSALKKTLSKIRRGKNIFGRSASSSEDHTGKWSSHMHRGFHMSVNYGVGKITEQDNKPMDAKDKSSNACESAGVDISVVEGDSAMDLDILHVLSLSEWANIIYDVSLLDISVHIPLHRLLSLLLQKAAKKCFGESVVPNTVGASSSNLSSGIHTDFFGHLLFGCHPHGFSSFIMEHPLQIRVFCAQVLAGMWRKNGDSALLSCELYRSVRWSEQCMELDLFLLQCCAALAPADLFINRILQRYGLSDYLIIDMTPSIEYEPVLVREMLTLIIQIVKERRFCGLTVSECLKRELVYKLATGDATRSQLVKSLPRDLSKCSQLQEILDDIAVYSNPSGFNQGMYSLRWTCWKELDLYHPRWSSRDLQIAEERYLRFCSVSALTNQLPKWTKIYPPFKGLARIATCKAVLQIVRTVVHYAVLTDRSIGSRAPDAVLLTALHLIALALDICSQQKESPDQSCFSGDSIPMLAFACEEVSMFSSVARGDCLLSLLVILMRKHKNENPENLLEAGSFNLSALVECLLKKFAELDSRCMAKVQQLAPGIFGHLSISGSDTNSQSSREILFSEEIMGNLSSTSDSEKRKAKARERQTAILEKMRAEQSKFLASVDSVEDDDSKSGEESIKHDFGDYTEEFTEVACSLCHDSSSNNPVSFLILLQKSKLLSFTDRSPPSWDQPSWTDEHVATNTNKGTDQSGVRTSSGGLGVLSPFQIAQLVQNAVKEYSSQGQPGEVVAFLEFLKARFPALRNIQVPGISNARGETSTYTFESLEEDMHFFIRKEMHDILLTVSGEGGKLLTARDGLTKKEDVESTLLIKCIATMGREMKENPTASENNRNDNITVECTRAYDGFGPADCDGIYLSSCGHAVHQGCLERYLSSLKERFVRRVVFEGGHIADPEQGEFLCPVCRRLANSVLPSSREEFQMVSKQPMSPIISSSSEEISSLSIQRALALLQSAANVIGNDKILKDLPVYRHQRTSPSLEPLSRALTKTYFPRIQDKFLCSTRVSPSMLMWDTLKYSLISMEIAARSRNYVIPTISLDSLYKELESSSGFILSLLLKVVQSMRSNNSLHMLQRFVGVQKFANSICSGCADYRSDPDGPGNLLGILKDVDLDIIYPDIQFWGRASDPVLAREPFSSLMWVLFCLPYPFLSCEESLLDLVHIFYLVSVAQAIITYCAKYQSKISELDFNNCLITDIYNVIGEFGHALNHFSSNYIDPSSDIMDTIRGLSFPYLRRCALLWKLLNSSARAPFFDGENMMDRSLAVNDMVDPVAVELTEVEKLEKMFKIPSLDIVLKDGLSRSLVLKWCDHVRKDVEAHKFKDIIYCTLAVPFQLIRLPYIYHDLLQRYIKQRCPECQTVIDDPALCLLCGRLCSPSWKSCCRKSGCQTHAMACGAGIGIFLLIRRTTILLQRAARQAPWQSPYLDAFGEEDIEMHRGKPLYLNEERYAALTYMVASHGLDRSSKVLGQTTIGSFFMI